MFTDLVDLINGLRSRQLRPKSVEEGTDSGRHVSLSNTNRLCTEISYLGVLMSPYLYVSRLARSRNGCRMVSIGSPCGRERVPDR